MVEIDFQAFFVVRADSVNFLFVNGNVVFVTEIENEILEALFKVPQIFWLLYPLLQIVLGLLYVQKIFFCYFILVVHLALLLPPLLRHHV